MIEVWLGLNGEHEPIKTKATRITDGSVWLPGGDRVRRSNPRSFYDPDKSKVWDWIIAKSRKDVELARSELHRAESVLAHRKHLRMKEHEMQQAEIEQFCEGALKPDTSARG